MKPSLDVRIWSQWNFILKVAALLIPAAGDTSFLTTHWPLVPTALTQGWAGVTAVPATEEGSVVLTDFVHHEDRTTGHFL